MSTEETPKYIRLAPSDRTNESTHVAWVDSPIECSTVVIQHQETNEQFFERCYFGPLRRMTVENDETFIVLMVLLPLYEKYWRVANQYDAFSLDASFFQSLGNDLALDQNKAEEFWIQFRHGLAHRAGIKKGVLVAQGPAIEKIENGFRVNPFALRDLLLTKIEPCATNWNRDSQCPIPKTYSHPRE